VFGIRGDFSLRRGGGRADPRGTPGRGRKTTTNAKFLYSGAGSR